VNQMARLAVIGCGRIACAADSPAPGQQAEPGLIPDIH
jgi:hypothetical protein